MARDAVTDEQWAIYETVIPGAKSGEGKRGRPAANLRTMLNGILWISRTGSPWRDVPIEYGLWGTVYKYFRKWQMGGVFNKLMDAVMRMANDLGLIDQATWAMDGTNVRATRAAGGAAKKSLAIHPEEPEDHALGMSRGGFGTKVNVVAELGKGLVLAVELGPGQEHEQKAMPRLMGRIRLPGKTGRPRTKPKVMALDKGYAGMMTRAMFRKRGVRVVMRRKSNEKIKTPANFDAATYRRRNLIERAIGWLKESRRVATRYEKLAVNFLAMIKLAIVKYYLRAIL